MSEVRSLLEQSFTGHLVKGLCKGGWWAVFQEAH